MLLEKCDRVCLDLMWVRIDHVDHIDVSYLLFTSDISHRSFVNFDHCTSKFYDVMICFVRAVASMMMMMILS